MTVLEVVDNSGCRCTDCGYVAKSPHGLRIHRMRAHEGRRWGSRAEHRPELVRPRVLTVLYVDSDSAVLATDEHGRTWLARLIEADEEVLR